MSSTTSLPGIADLEAAAEIVYQTLTPTPQTRWPLLAERMGCDTWVKHENHTPIGAFKIRGGLVYMNRIKQAEPGIEGVVSATTGNHGQSIAISARLNGLHPVLVTPIGNSPDKNAAMRAHGAELIEHGADFDEAHDLALELKESRNLHYVPSFHPDLVAGVGTYSLEFLRAVPDLDTVYVPVGLGSGICGMIAARDALGVKTTIVGVVSKGADCYARSFEAREPVPTNAVNTFTGGLAVRNPHAGALDVILGGVDRVVRVSDDAILTAMGWYFTDTHNVAEGAGASSLAALAAEKDRMAGKKVGLVLSGGNIDAEVYVKALEKIG